MQKNLPGIPEAQHSVRPGLRVRFPLPGHRLSETRHVVTHAPVQGRSLQPHSRQRVAAHAIVVQMAGPETPALPSLRAETGEECGTKVGISASDGGQGIRP